MEIQEVIESTSPNMRSMLESDYFSTEDETETGKFRKGIFNLLLCSLKLYENRQNGTYLAFDFVDREHVSIYPKENGVELELDKRNRSYSIKDKFLLILIGSYLTFAKFDSINKKCRTMYFADEVMKIDKLMYVEFLGKDPENYPLLYSGIIIPFIKYNQLYRLIFNVEGSEVELKCPPREIRINNYAIGPSDYTIKKGLLDNMLSQIDVD